MKALKQMYCQLPKFYAGRGCPEISDALQSRCTEGVVPSPPGLQIPRTIKKKPIREVIL